MLALPSRILCISLLFPTSRFAIGAVSSNIIDAGGGLNCIASVTPRVQSCHSELMFLSKQHGISHELVAQVTESLAYDHGISHLSLKCAEWASVS